MFLQHVCEGLEQLTIGNRTQFSSLWGNSPYFTIGSSRRRAGAPGVRLLWQPTWEQGWVSGWSQNKHYMKLRLFNLKHPCYMKLWITSTNNFGNFVLTRYKSLTRWHFSNHNSKLPASARSQHHYKLWSKSKQWLGEHTSMCYAKQNSCELNWKSENGYNMMNL